MGAPRVGIMDIMLETFDMDWLLFIMALPFVYVTL